MVSAVSDVADKIRSFLHFSVPDEGPLTDYESWMPDFMGGLARGIERSRGLVRKAVEGVAGDMVVSPKLADMQAVQAQGASLEAVRQMVSGLREMFAGMQSGENFGDDLYSGVCGRHAAGRSGGGRAGKAELKVGREVRRHGIYTVFNH